MKAKNYFIVAIALFLLFLTGCSEKNSEKEFGCTGTFHKMLKKSQEREIILEFKEGNGSCTYLFSNNSDINTNLTFQIHFEEGDSKVQVQRNNGMLLDESRWSKEISEVANIDGIQGAFKIDDANEEDEPLKINVYVEDFTGEVKLSW
ncbi:hypothetical protein [Caldalkalibacillus mannanilyticus]|uniref:hypothetical protein n=1 Tax=Caldalkalibacillus mannanilyticus TaxID=1418 RepID=UPI000468874F|nr:hypothetical protein [Caldalkalibacillus mannanilyticus]